MQIDVLSQNTLKLTLTRLDMFDLDIKYESLSGKNPETKRLLSHVLKSIQLDKKVGFDFSGERLFVEAFPRPDGGCMLYISSLENESFAKRTKRAGDTLFQNDNAQTKSRTKNETLFHSNPMSKGKVNMPQHQGLFLPPPAETFGYKALSKPQTARSCRICELNGFDVLGMLSKKLCWFKKNKGLAFESSLYLGESANSQSVYRLVINSDNPSLLSMILCEFGEIISSEYEIMNTSETFKPLIKERAVETIRQVMSIDN
ncbi:MAG: adaptor protein MecA [Oscillospiraceae bacterium]|nr:adaptor protein MecA [Oscillospiraceae bacterium]